MELQILVPNPTPASNAATLTSQQPQMQQLLHGLLLLISLKL